MLLFVLEAASWAHGRQDNNSLAESKNFETERNGIINAWEREERLKVMALVELLYKISEGKEISSSRMEPAEEGFRNTIFQFLKKQTMNITHLR